MIKLRDVVIDTITGLTGVVIGRCEYLNGCVQCEVQPKGLNKGGVPFKPEWVDEGQLTDLSGSLSQGAQEASLGGPHDAPVRSTPPL